MASLKSSRSLSASEIAKRQEYFESWAKQCNCVNASMEEVPAHMRGQIEKIFNVSRRLPSSLIDESSEVFKALKMTVPEVVTLLKRAEDDNAKLFSPDVTLASSPRLVRDLGMIQEAWEKQKLMGKSSVKWTEADRASQVYSFIRNPAMKQNRLRLQSRIGLPKPIDRHPHVLDGRGKSVDVLSAQMAIPDAAVYLSRTALKNLHHGSKSPYSVLQAHSPLMPFAANATPGAQLPERPSFEFASSVWEDKKPDHTEVEHAYRQNLMSTAAVARHLYAFKIKAPVIGLVWADGTVRAHIDWVEKRDGKLTVLSARYSPSASEDRRESNMSAASAQADFQGWRLSSPADIIAVCRHDSRFRHLSLFSCASPPRFTHASLSCT